MTVLRRTVLVCAILLAATSPGFEADGPREDPGSLVSAVPASATERPPEILLSRQLMDARDLRVGDVVRLSADPDGASALPFLITGEYEPVPDPFRLTTKRYEARFHLPDLIALTADPEDPAALESVTRVNLALRDPADVGSFAEDLSRTLPGLYVRPTNRSDDGSDPFVVLDRFHTAIAAVTVVGSAAFLLALMVIRSEERRETAGILRLIGFSRPRILMEIFIEGVIIAVAGAVAGILIALALENLFNRFFQWHYDTALVFVRVSPGIALKCIVIAVPLGVLAGVTASWSLLRRDIMTLLRR